MNSKWVENHIINHNHTLEDQTQYASLQHMNNEHFTSTELPEDTDKNFLRRFKNLAF
ncbi:MAG: hypothetical protein PHV30_10195 [Candidatus Margulisbacteria bacterium]|nr:hypothetical protein [Candidatus Margulisiibacteriota bacterium]